MGFTNKEEKEHISITKKSLEKSVRCVEGVRWLSQVRPSSGRNRAMREVGGGPVVRLWPVCTTALSFVFRQWKPVEVFKCTVTGISSLVVIILEGLVILN